MSRCGAEAYIQSKVRLESSCGISDVWYNYVESNLKFFTRPTTLITPSSMATPSGPNSSPRLFPSSPSVHPRPNAQEMKEIESLFVWQKAHSRPLPTKKVVTTDTLQFSKASAHLSLQAVLPTQQENLREAVSSRKPMEMEKEEQREKEPALVKEEIQHTLGSFMSVEELDEWPNDPSFIKCLDLAVDQAAAALEVSLQASEELAHMDTTEAGGGIDGPGISRKRPRSDSDDRK